MPPCGREPDQLTYDVFHLPRILRGIATGPGRERAGGTSTGTNRQRAPPSGGARCFALAVNFPVAMCSWNSHGPWSDLAGELSSPCEVDLSFVPIDRRHHLMCVSVTGVCHRQDVAIVASRPKLPPDFSSELDPPKRSAASLHRDDSLLAAARRRDHRQLAAPVFILDRPGHARADDRDRLRALAFSLRSHCYVP